MFSCVNNYCHASVCMSYLYLCMYTCMYVRVFLTCIVIIVNMNYFNPYRPDPGQREKNSLNFYFYISL